TFTKFASTNAAPSVRLARMSNERWADMRRQIVQFAGEGDSFSRARWARTRFDNSLFSGGIPAPVSHDTSRIRARQRRLNRTSFAAAPARSILLATINRGFLA